MTQSPHGAHAAPATSEFDDDGVPHGAPTPDLHRDFDGPSPNTPTNSTPWGSTSTSTGIRYGSDWPSATYDAPSAPYETTQSPVADAPTSTVPLVQGSAAPPQTGFPSRPSVPPPAQSVPTVPPPGGAGGAVPRAARARGPRRARLQLRHINPWTVLKFSCVLSIALFFVWLIVIGVLYGVLDGAGIIHKINDAYTTIQGNNSKAPVTAGVVFGGAAIIGAVNIVLFVALTTVGSVIYNLCADLVGGIEITLSES
jgi:hypothetical protein